MEREEIFFGKDFDETEKTKVEKDVSLIKERTRRPLEGELEKTQEQLRFIELLDGYLQKELEEIGIDDGYSLFPEQFHLMPRDVFEKHIHDFVPAFHTPIENNIYINTTRMNEQDVYHSMIHEAIHGLSYHKVHVDPKENKLKVYRIGYETINVSTREPRRFEGVTEGITEKMAREIYERHKEEFLKEVGLDVDLEPSMPVMYGEYIHILDIIMEKLAAEKNEDIQEVWRRFKRGMFSGDMMHLSDIEDVFGKGSLRVLANLHSGKSHLTHQELSEKVEEYFQCGDSSVRDGLASEILEGDDLEKYGRLNGK